MKSYYEQDGIQLFLGDCRDVLRALADCSVDSVVTDPPYELGFMGKSWDRSGIAYQVEVWRECLRLLKPGGHLLAFGGSRTYHRLACAIEDAGFEIRDQIQWLYGSGFPKSLDISKAIDAAAGAERKIIGNTAEISGRTVGLGTSSGFHGDIVSGHCRDITAPSTDAAKQWNGWGTALKPAHEPIVMARKPLEGTVAENVLKHGTGGINVDGCRIEASEKTPAPVGRYVGSSIGPIGHNGLRDGNADQLGRWPANVIHDGSDEVVSLFPETNEGRFPAVQNTQSWKMSSLGKALAPERTLESGSAARFFYCPKASKEDREEGLDDLPIRSAGEVTDRQDGTDGLNSPRAGAGRTNGSRNHHPTVKPTELMRYLVRLVTPPNGTVLDHFAGSGSTGKACALEILNSILIEKEVEYCEIAMRRARLRQRRLTFA